MKGEELRVELPPQFVATGEQRSPAARFAVAGHHQQIGTGLGVWNGRAWPSPAEPQCVVLGLEHRSRPRQETGAAGRELRAAPAIPDSKIAGVPQHSGSAAARNGSAEATADLQRG